MKATIISLAILLMATFSFSFDNGKGNDLKYRLEHLSGTYADAKPYQYGKAWGKRVFTFSKGRWTLLFTMSLDPEMKMKVFQFRTLGTYKVQEPSDKVTGAYNALFNEEKKFVTLRTGDAKLAQAFGFGGCGLETNVEKDISATGCSAWKPVADCPGDYDLLSLDKAGKLYFGERPADNDMCSPEKRPNALTPPVVKVK